MFQFPHVEVELRNTFGQPILNEAGVVQTLDTRLVLLGVIADPSFVGDLKGVEAAVFAFEAKQEIDGQAVEAEQRGYWLIEDARARRFQKSVLQMGFNPLFAHCLVPLLLAVRDATRVP